MVNPDLKKLSRKQLIAHFEQERQEWLDAGMNEADIFCIHFGNKEENGRGGDYRVWLDERKHIRPDHKYAFGIPASINEIDPDGVWISNGHQELDDVETQTDFERALSTLTELQRYSIIEICLKERTYRDVARECGKHYTTIAEAVKAAKEKIKKYF